MKPLKADYDEYLILRRMTKGELLFVKEKGSQLTDGLLGQTRESAELIPSHTIDSMIHGRWIMHNSEDDIFELTSDGEIVVETQHYRKRQRR